AGDDPHDYGIRSAELPIRSRGDDDQTVERRVDRNRRLQVAADGRVAQAAPESAHVDRLVAVEGLQRAEIDVPMHREAPQLEAGHGRIVADAHRDEDRVADVDGAGLQRVDRDDRSAAVGGTAAAATSASDGRHRRALIAARDQRDTAYQRRQAYQMSSL